MARCRELHCSAVRPIVFDRGCNSRIGATWALVVPLLVAGLLCGHELAYRIALPDVEERAHELAASGHGYLHYAPAFLVGTLAALVVAFARSVANAKRRRPTATISPWLYVALATGGFAVQEAAERFAHASDVDAGLLTQRAFLLGLGLQVPFAVVAVAIARALERGARLVARALVGPRHRSEVLSSVVRPIVWLGSAPEPLAAGSSGRGPPSPA